MAGSCGVRSATWGNLKQRSAPHTHHSLLRNAVPGCGPSGLGCRTALPSVTWGWDGHQEHRARTERPASIVLCRVLGRHERYPGCDSSGLFQADSALHRSGEPDKACHLVPSATASVDRSAHGRSFPDTRELYPPRDELSTVLLYHPAVARQKAQSRTRKVRRLVEITEHRCLWCGEWFETLRADARYCPQPKICRLQAHRARLKKGN